MTGQMPRRPNRLKLAAMSLMGVHAVLAALVAWNLSSLRGLPDIGDPFDVAAFSKRDIRDEDNAFVLYRQAAAKFHKREGLVPQDWPSAIEPEQRWLAENREALDLWRRGTERPDASFVPTGELTFETNMDLLQYVRVLGFLACLEGSRSESEGDLSGAWSWYRAALRSSHHCGRRGTLIERLVGTAIHGRVSDQIRAWSSLPGVDAKALRQAQAEVQSIDALTAPMSDGVKVEYLSFVRTMGRPDMLWKFLETIDRAPGSAETRSPKEIIRRVEAFVKREPERSRRLLSLVTANWLAYCDRPLADRPPLAPRHDGLCYVADPSSPPNARRLSADRLNAWFDTTILMRSLFPALRAVQKAVDRERARQASLVIHLATELYQREHGKPPASPED